MDDFEAEQLPPYSLREPVVVIASEFPPSYFSSQVARLAKFLRFCLVIDYNCLGSLPSRYWITKADFIHFTTLAKHCFVKSDMNGVHNIRYDSNLHCTDPLISEELIEPAAAMGIPGPVVISMLRIFVMSISRNNKGYHSAIDQICHEHGLTTIAQKFHADRHKLFKRLLPSEGPLRHAMFSASRTAIRRWFCELNSGTSYSLSKAGNDRDMAENLHLTDFVQSGLYRTVRSDCLFARWLAVCYQTPSRKECKSFYSWTLYGKAAKKRGFLFREY